MRFALILFSLFLSAMAQGNSIKVDLTEGNSLRSDSIERDSVTDGFIGVNSLKGSFIKNDSPKGNFIESNSIKGDFIKSDSIQIGCIKKITFCSPNGECRWAAQQGRVLEVDLKKTGTAPEYEIWEGQLDSQLYGQLFQLEIYQRRSSGEKYNYLTIDMPLSSDISLTGSGRDVALVRYFQDSTQSGIGIRCTSELIPGNKNLD